MKVIRPLNRELTHEDVGKKIADIGEVCEEEGFIISIPAEDEEYSYLVEDYTPKVKKGTWEKFPSVDGWYYKTPAGRSYVINCIEEADDYRILKESLAFNSLEEAKSFVESEYEKYVLSLIEVGE